MEAVGLVDGSNNTLKFELTFTDWMDTWEIGADIVAGEDVEYVPGTLYFEDNNGYKASGKDCLLRDCLFEANSAYVNRVVEDFAADYAAEQNMEIALDAREDAARGY